MQHNVLKSLVGRYLSSHHKLGYCHVDRVIIVEGQTAIVTAFVKTFNDHLFYWFCEVSWQTDKYGVHEITNINILKEDDLSGSNAKDEQSLSSGSKGL